MMMMYRPRNVKYDNREEQVETVKVDIMAENGKNMAKQSKISKINDEIKEIIKKQKEEEAHYTFTGKKRRIKKSEIPSTVEGDLDEIADCDIVEFQ